MDTLYGHNGLVFWSEKEIRIRDMMVGHFVNGMREVLRDENKAFEFIQVEAPILTPSQFVNTGYTVEDYFMVDDKCYSPDAVTGNTLALRPETTMGSYRYVRWLLEQTSLRVRLPVCVWQHGKSFRREQNQPSKHMRLKEFYQLEFQCVYGKTTANDYSKAVVPAVRGMISDMLGDCHVEKSDRLPAYSSETLDVVMSDNGMELCSVSKRSDFPDANVLEVAVGTDRCVYNWFRRKGAQCTPTTC